MEASKSASKAGSAQIAAAWGDSSSLEQIYVDELLVTLAKGRAYLTFGQLAIASSPDVSKASAEIRPVARLVVSRESLRPMIDVLNQLLESEAK
jgi:hypothetical protein